MRPQSLHTGNPPSKLVKILALAALGWSLSLPPGLAAQEATYTVLHKFTGGADGANPMAGLIADQDGNLYGTTTYGGSFNYGTVFKLEPSAKETVLHNFAGGEGMWPEGTLLLDQSGNLYGTTTNGGTPEGGSCRFGCGTVFKIDSTGSYTVLYAFTGGADGSNPSSSLILDHAGNLYGTAAGGNYEYGCFNGCGVVYKVDPHGKETVLYTFNELIGPLNPSGGLVRDVDGNFYGPSLWGGSTSTYGTVYKLDRAGEETVLYSFTDGTDGAGPQGTLVRDEAGNLYGVTQRGGDDSARECASGSWLGCGVVFSVDTSGNESVLYTFTDSSDGAFPNGGLLRDEAGNLYGTTPGNCCGGTLFKVSPDGNFYLLHTFEAETGYVPVSGVVSDRAGSLYGTTWEGGLGKCLGHGCGVVYKISR